MLQSSSFYLLARGVFLYQAWIKTRHSCSTVSQAPVNMAIGNDSLDNSGPTWTAINLQSLIMSRQLEAPLILILYLELSNSCGLKLRIIVFSLFHPFQTSTRTTLFVSKKKKEKKSRRMLNFVWITCIRKW